MALRQRRTPMERLRNVKTRPELPRRARGFLVKAELRLTPVNKGIGIFAAEFIPAKTRVDDPHILYFDEQETLKLLAAMPNDDARRDWLEHAFKINGKVGAYDTTCMMMEWLITRTIQTWQ